MRSARTRLLTRNVKRAAAQCAVLFVGIGVGAARAGDAELGRYLSSECVTCHGAARTGGQIPNIYGLEEGTFEQVVKAYRNKQLPNEVMQTVAARLKDDEIAALATYFAKAKKPH